MISKADYKKAELKKDGKVKENPGIYDAEFYDRHEIIHGIRYDMLSSPKYVHQKILTNLHLGFHNACSQEGEILLAPMDVHFDEDNVVQPDVIYIARENLSIIRDGYIFGSPDLIVEILSKSTGNKDKTIKLELYEKFGVKEYWLVDPAYRTVDQFVLDNEKYKHFMTLSSERTIHSPTIACLSIALDSVFPAEEL